MLIQPLAAILNRPTVYTLPQVVEDFDNRPRANILKKNPYNISSMVEMSIRV